MPLIYSRALHMYTVLIMWFISSTARSIISIASEKLWRIYFMFAQDWRLNIPFSVLTAFDLSKHYFILHIILIIIITCTLTIFHLFFNLYNYLRRWYKRRYENQAVICSILFTLFLPEMMPPPPQPPPQGDPPPQTFTEYVYKPRLSQLTQC